MAATSLLRRGVLCLQLAAALRWSPEQEGGIQWPMGPEVVPEGRHIQMLFRDSPHGLTDRIMKYFRPLVVLGMYYNATVHLRGGKHGVAEYLAPDHTEELGDTWGRYFNLEAHDGNPWHEPENFVGCKKVSDTFNEKVLMNLFRGNTRCVNFVAELPPFGRLPWDIKNMKPDLPVSAHVRMAANQFMERYGFGQQGYGSCHVRRCDYLSGQEDCTSPDTIANLVRDSSDSGNRLRTWVFFMYAERGYKEALAEKLAPLGVNALFEGDVVLNDLFPKDNYFTYIVSKYLNGGASVILETHHCRSSGKPGIYSSESIDGHGIFLPRTRSSQWTSDADEAFMASEEEALALCDNRHQGAKLLKPGNAYENATDPLVERHVR